MSFFELDPVNRRRWRKFRRARAGFWSLLLLVVVYGASLGCETFIGNRPVVLRWRGEWSFPAFTNRYYSQRTFGGNEDLEVDFRELAASGRVRAAGGLLLMPLHPYSPLESITIPGDPPPSHPTRGHPLGTDDRGRDILARVVYGFRISMSFALILATLSYLLGITIGAVQGYWGGWLDLGVQRLIEIWTVLPFLYVVILISSIVTPSMPILIAILLLFGWITISYYVRAEVLRQRGMDYVTAARALGASWPRILLRHVLSNAMTPVVTLFPFALAADIFTLSALDFLGFGLPPPTPSWGELFAEGRANIESWWLIVFPFLALFMTLLLTTFVGEALREAWDPKEHHRRV